MYDHKLYKNNSSSLLKFNFKNILGIILSLLGLYLAFHDFNFVLFSDQINKTNYLFVAIACISIAFSVWIRAVRWRLLIQSEDITINNLFNIEMVGYFGNNIFPFRMGEIYRGVLLSYRTNLSKSYCLGTIVLERITDMLGLIFLFFILMWFYPLSSEIKDWGYKIIFFTFLIIGIIIFLKKYFNLFPNIKINFINQFIAGFTGINLENFFLVLMWTLILWFIYWFDTYLIQLAFDLQMTWEQILLLLVLTSVAMAIPSAPGMIGTFHLAVKFTMVSILGFDTDISNAFSIILHAYGYITLTIIGAYYFFRSFQVNLIK